MVNYDINLFLYLNQLGAYEGWMRFFAFITHLGNGWTQAALIVPAFYFFKRKYLFKHLPALVITAALGGLLVVGMKQAVARQRPPQYFTLSDVSIHTAGGAPTDYSFPSGHTQTAFSTAAYLCCLYPAGSPLFLSLAALVGLSRVVTGVHFPLDVLIGALLGLACGIAGFRLNRRCLDRSSSFSA